MQGLKDKRYLANPKKRFDPITLLFSVGLLGAVLVSAVGVEPVVATPDG